MSSNAAVLMADGINTDAMAIRQRFGPARPVMCPVDGEYAWSPAEQAMFSQVIRYSVLSDSPGIARYARVKDVEARLRVGGDAGPQDVPGFLLERAAFGHDDGTVYCSLDTVPYVLDAIRTSGMPLVGDEPRLTVPRWLLAWYWQRPGEPSREHVLGELMALTGIALPPELLWGCQYVTHSLWDRTIVYGAKDFAR